jgi:HAD superfamily hydrolase (TIGR01459 family)
MNDSLWMMNLDINLERKNFLSAIDNYEVLLFDIWGVVFNGQKTYDGVVDMINKVSTYKKVLFVSNSPNPADILMERIKSWGISTSIENIITSGQITRDILTNLAYPKRDEDPKITSKCVYHLGEDRNQNIIKDLDLIKCDDIESTKVLLLTLYRDEEENITEFNDVLKTLAEKGVLCICANPDVTIPYNGKIRYCAGYFAKVFESFGGKVDYIGKPYKAIYDRVFEKYSDIPKNKILMVGDTFETDILGAQVAKIDSALVMTGNAFKIHENCKSDYDKLNIIKEYAKKIGIMPTFITNLQE